jgi:hypothetical protein
VSTSHGHSTQGPALPRGERVLWQGAPAWRAVYLRVFHARALAAYFGLILAARAAVVLADGGGVADAALAVGWLLPAPLFALGMLALMAWLVERTSRYTITDRRVVMRIGMVLDVTFNFPFSVVESAALRTWPDGTGDVSIAFMPGNQIGYAHLWPHARPWRLRRAEPALRCVRDAAAVGRILSRALAEATGGTPRTAAAPTDLPTSHPIPSGATG